MQENPSGKRGDVRQSALWGSGNRGGELRSNALWGKGGRGVAVACMLLAIVVPAGAVAKDKDSERKYDGRASSYVPQGLLAAAAAEPNKMFDVIVEAAKAGANNDERADKAGDASRKHNGKLKRKFRSIPGVSVEIKGGELLRLADDPNVSSITPNSAMQSQAYQDNEIWRAAIGADSLWGSSGSAPQAPAIAVVDSGIDPSDEFGERIVAAVAICSMCADSSTADQQGHGTMVAALASSGNPAATGVAPNAPIVSLRTANAQGESLVSDVIAAADWIIANKAQYSIRVANFSLSRGSVTNPLHDPLNHAVQRLWFNDIVVVAAAGNHGSAASQVAIKSPGSDQFVITAGATDTSSTSGISDDFVPSWSAHGYSVIGFAKPELSAPGRYMVAPVPAQATLAREHPDRVLADGRMWMSGTSFSSAVVAGAAAQLLARHPNWTPDQVKGALMLKARPMERQEWKGGVGEVDVAGAAAVTSPPNPNSNLYAFVVGSGGDRSFDGKAWNSYVAENPTWSSTGWAETGWAETGWAETGWAETGWAENVWAETGWAETGWAETGWADTGWADTGWAEAGWKE